MGSLKLKSKCELYDFEKLFKKKGYAYFTQGDYNLNIIGVRAKVDGNKVTNLYDDVLVVIYSVDGRVKKRVYQYFTTDPGRYYMTESLGNPKGTAILVPGQYRKTWKIGKHRGKYQALCQSKPVKVYRDRNKDNVYDMKPETIDNGIFGINIHRSNELYTRETIDKYSAGCQVFANPTDFGSFMYLCREQQKRYGNSFTYTLLNEEDLV